MLFKLELDYHLYYNWYFSLLSYPLSSPHTKTVFLQFLQISNSSINIMCPHVIVASPEHSDCLCEGKRNQSKPPF